MGCIQASPTLNLVRDYVRFVIAFFEIIDTSAPHIYHSALLLSPLTSITHEIYKTHASPLARVVQGIPDSWERVVASATFDHVVRDAVWSPCNRFIAVTTYDSVEVLDAVTLSRVSIFENSSRATFNLLSFSPDGRCLTLCVEGALISWDLQTGSPLGTINCWDLPTGSPLVPTHHWDLQTGSPFVPTQPWDFQTGTPLVPTHNWGLQTRPFVPTHHWGFQARPFSAIRRRPERSNDWPISSTHSEDGKLIAVAYKSQARDDNDVGHSSFIRTYDLRSGKHVGSHYFPGERIIHPIWPHDSYLRFATINPKLIRIWQSPFTLEPPPVEVASFLVPDGITDAERFLLLPSLSRLAFVLKNTIQVWDLKTPKLLLKSELAYSPKYDKRLPPQSSFSSNGQFFAYTTIGEGVHVWKESPTGYLPHQRLPIFADESLVGPRLSPNGESIIVPLQSKIHRSHTRDQAPSLPSVSTGGSEPNQFTLGFSPDKNFAAFARQGENTVTIIDLKSGEQKWNADVGLEIGCVGMAGGTVIIVGEDSIVTWNLPSGDRTFNASINDIVRTTILDPLPSSYIPGMPNYMSISPDLSRITVMRSCSGSLGRLEVDDVSTGLCLARINTAESQLRPYFTRDGREVWTGNYSSRDKEECEIIEDSESGAIELKLQLVFAWDFPESSHGYTVTGGWWVLSPSQRRLLWLPHRWRSHRVRRTWGGRFLGLLDGELSEVVVLEFLK